MLLAEAAGVPRPRPGKRILAPRKPAGIGRALRAAEVGLGACVTGRPRRREGVTRGAERPGVADTRELARIPDPRKLTRVPEPRKLTRTPDLRKLTGIPDRAETSGAGPAVERVGRDGTGNLLRAGSLA